MDRKTNSLNMKFFIKKTILPFEHNISHDLPKILINELKFTKIS